MTQVQRYHQLVATPTRPRKRQLLEPRLILRDTKDVFLAEDARIGGVLQIGPSGWSKSLWLARTAFQDCLNGLPQVVLDVGGQTIQGFFSEVAQQTYRAQELTLEKVVYCPMSGMRGWVPALPLLSPLRPQEPLSLTASRIPKLLSQLDVNFATASIQGLTRTIPIAMAVCTVLRALRLPLSHAHDLLLHPELWVRRIQYAAEINPEAYLAAEDLFEYMALPRKERELRSEPFRNRLYLLRNPIDRAILASPRLPTVDFDYISQTGKTLLIDLSGEHDTFALQWKLLWVFNLLCEWIAGRGRNAPLFGVIVDELSHFTRGEALHTRAIVEQFSSLIDVRMRNNRIALIVSSQRPENLDPELLSAVLQLKTHMFGSILDYSWSVEFTKRYFPFKDEVKYWQRVWASNPGDVRAGIPPTHFVIDHIPVFRSWEEMIERNRRAFDLKPGEWVLAKSTGEGHHGQTLQKISTQYLFKPPFPADNEGRIAQLQAHLASRDGCQVREVLAEIERTRLVGQGRGETNRSRPQAPSRTQRQTPKAARERHRRLANQRERSAVPAVPNTVVLPSSGSQEAEPRQMEHTRPPQRGFGKREG